MKPPIMALGTFLALAGISLPVNAGSLRQGSTGSSGAVTESLPGQVLWTYFQTINTDGEPLVATCPPADGDGGFEDRLCNNVGVGDNIIRLINPNGAANGNLAGAREQTVCAMIYVFDDDEEMGECCGCPLSSTRLATFSVKHNLASNWGLPLSEIGAALTKDNAYGAIAIVAAAPNTIGFLFGSNIINPGGGGFAGQCLNGACCDPTNVPGYSVTVASNLLGSITHNQLVIGPPLTVDIGITETPLSDDAGGDPTNLVYLQSQCGALIGNGSGGGVCNCPLE